MKLVTAPKPVAIVEATREELDTWIQATAAGGIMLPAKEAHAHWWISPTGLCFLFVPPQLGEKAPSLTTFQVESIHNVMKDLAESLGYSVDSIIRAIKEYPRPSQVKPRAKKQEATA